MPEIVGAFSTLEGGEEGANGAADAFTGALGELAHVRLEFAVGHLDRVEIGRILRQVAQRSAGCRNRRGVRLSLRPPSPNDRVSG